MTLRKILSTACLLVVATLSSLSQAADNSAILGKWVLDFNAGGQSSNFELLVTEGANGLEGIWTGFGGQTSPISAASFDGTTLTFTRTGQQGQVTQTFALVDGSLKGNMNSQQGEVAVTAKKQE